MLVDHFQEENKAFEYYQDFKWKVIAGLNEWEITGYEITPVISQIELERANCA